MRVLVYRPYEHGELVEVQNELESLQDLVGGYIEHYPVLPEYNIGLLINEEGIWQNLPQNRHLLNNNELLATFFGNMVFLSTDGEEFTGLSDAQIDLLDEWVGLWYMDRGEIT